MSANLMSATYPVRYVTLVDRRSCSGREFCGFLF